MTSPKSLSVLIAAVMCLCLGIVLSPTSIEGAETDEQHEGSSAPNRVEIADSDRLRLTGDKEQRTELAQPPDETESENDAELAAETERFLSGQVLDQDYEPVAGAWVIADVEAEPVLSNEDGTFQLPLLKPFDGDNGRSLRAWKEGLSLARKYVRQQEGVLIILKKDELKEIRILDSDSGIPLAGATVKILVEVKSESGDGFFDLRRFSDLPMVIEAADGDGKVKIPDPKISERYSIEVEMDGYDRRLVDWWSIRRADVVKMARPEEQRMRFVRKDGTPHAGARLCFPWIRRTLTLDDDGWATLPTEARWGFWAAQLVDENTQWVFVQVESDQIQNGASLTTEYFPRSGQLFVQGNEKASAYEIATSAVWSSWGENYMPDPIWGDLEDLVWAPINDKGEFHIKRGWQSDETVLHVRRAGAKSVLLSQKILGQGPYELSLAAAATLTARVECAHPELLEGASLKFYGNRTDHEATQSLAEASVEVRLPADKYQVSLMLADFSHDLPLGEINLIGMDVEHTFHFEGIRTISGTVRAGGTVVFPCEINLNSEQGFWTRVDTNPSGQWELKGAPTGKVTLRLKPENKWLAPIDGSSHVIPMGQATLDIDLPVATLLLSAGNIPLDQLENLRVSRQHLPDVNPFNNRRWYGSSRPKIPDLSQGPVEILLGPSAVTFQSGRSQIPLGETRIELREGEVRAFQLRTVSTCLVSLRIEGFSRRIWASFNLEPIHVPDLETYPSFHPQPGPSENLPGQIGQSMHVLPGTWKITVRAPFWSSEYRAQVGKGKLEFEMDFQSEWKEIWLRLGKDGQLERVAP